MHNKPEDLRARSMALWERKHRVQILAALATGDRALFSGTPDERAALVARLSTVQPLPPRPRRQPLPPPPPPQQQPIVAATSMRRLLRTSVEAYRRPDGGVVDRLVAEWSVQCVQQASKGGERWTSPWYDVGTNASITSHVRVDARQWQQVMDACRDRLEVDVQQIGDPNRPSRAAVVLSWYESPPPPPSQQPPPPPSQQPPPPVVSTDAAVVIKPERGNDDVRSSYNSPALVIIDRDDDVVETTVTPHDVVKRNRREIEPTESDDDSTASADSDDDYNDEAYYLQPPPLMRMQSKRARKQTERYGV